MDIDSSQNNDNTSWLNKKLVKATLAGLILFFGCNIAGIFRIYFMVEPTTFFTQFITSIVVPVVIIYLVAVVSNKILMRFGFEGFWLIDKKGEGVGGISVLGLLLGLFIGFILLLLAMLFWTTLKTYVDIDQLSGYIEQLMGLLLVAGIVVFLLYRFRLIRRAKES